MLWSGTLGIAVICRRETPREMRSKLRFMLKEKGVSIDEKEMDVEDDFDEDDV